MRSNSFVCIAVAVALALVPLVSQAGSSEQVAEKVARDWLALVDSGDYGKSWDTAAALFKGAITEDQWKQSLKAVRPALGKALSREVISAQYATSLPGAPDGEYVVIQFETSFENKSSAVETITPMKDPDGKWRVSGYYIR